MVTGSRKWQYKDVVWSCLGEQYQAWLATDPDDNEQFIVVHGGAVGADTFAQNWADYMSATRDNVGVEVHNPDLKSYGSPAAYHIRNAEMISSLPDFALVFIWNEHFNESRGTMSTWQGIKKRHIKHQVWRVENRVD